MLKNKLYALLGIKQKVPMPISKDMYGVARTARSNYFPTVFLH